jgi:beta-mannosidase
MPRGMGTLYWQLNDCWPVASWSSIDYKGNWKALHYMARSFYAQVLVSGVEDIEKGSVEMHVTNDTLSGVKGELSWKLFDIEGSILNQDSFEAEAGPNANTLIKIVDVSGTLKEKGTRNSIMYIEFKTCGGVISDNLVFFSRPKHMELVNPEIKSSIKAVGLNKFSVSMECMRPALWVWLEIEGVQARYSDRFFNMMPGSVRTVTVEIPDEMKLELIKKNLKINSLYNTYQ